MMRSISHPGANQGRNTTTSIFWVLALMLLWTLPSMATPVPGQGNKIPLVMIALDSSGSMEYLEADGEIPQCIAPFYLKNRWAIAQEVLTGSFPSYACSIDNRITPNDREDYAYPVPHVQYNFTEGQASDGLLDINGDVIKFAYMSFDTHFGTNSDASGGWSYGTDVNAPTLAKNLGLSSINIGARNENAYRVDGDINSYTGGGLVKFLKGTEDSPSSLLTAKSNEVQTAIINTIPFGGTPLSPMLKDIEFYFSTDVEMQAFDTTTNTGDPAWACRSRNVILITDGKPSMGEGDGYPLSTESASDLYFSHPLGVNIYVVGYNLEDTSDLALLDEIAAIGDPTNEDAHAYIANNAQELVFALSQVLGAITAGIQSRTLSIHTNSTNNAVDAQYQFNTASGDLPINTIDRQGYVEQDIYRCSSDCAVEGISGAQFCESFSINDAVNASTDEAPVYLIQGAVMETLSKTNDQLTPDVFDIPNGGTPENPTEPVGQLMNLEPIWTADGSKQVLGTEILGYSNKEEDREAYKNQLIDLILATPGSRRHGFRVGGILHGTPAILDAPSAGGGYSPSYDLFKTQVKNRPTTLFAPTHMGELMAFQIDRPDSLDSTDYGQHLWSVVPNKLVPRLQENADTTIFLMDLSPSVRNILLYKYGVNSEPEDEVKNWRSVLIQGYRNERGYFALNITDPESPELMWEVSPEERCWTISGFKNCSENTFDDNNFCYLGNTLSKPVITTLFLTNYNQLTGGGLHERAVAIFGGGEYDEGPSSQQIQCGNENKLETGEIGQALYVLDLETGSKIKEFRPSLGNVIGKNGSTSIANVKAAMKYDMVGTPACFNTSLGSVTTRCFIGDEGGQLWRLDLSSGDPDDWRLSFFHDAYEDLPGSTRSPIFEAPTLALEGTSGLLAVLYGTGNIDYTESASANHVVYSLLEKLDFNEDGGLSDASSITSKVNWKRIFTDGTSVMGTPVVFDEVAYFTTFQLDPTNTCTTPEDAAKLWGVHYINSTSTDPDIIGDPIGALDLDGDPLTADDVEEFIVLPEGIPYGVDIIQRPSCAGEFPLTNNADNTDESTDYNSSNIEQGDTELVVQFESANADASASGSDGSAQKTTTFVQKLKKPAATLTPISWGLIFD